MGFLTGIVNAKVLGPEKFGVLGNIMLILTYISFSSLGVLYSMNREYVIFESNSDSEGTRKVLWTTFTFLSILSVVLLVVSIGTLYLIDGILRDFILLIFIIGIFDQYRNFYVNYFRLTNRYRGINHIELIKHVLSFIIIIITIKYFEIYSVLVAMLITSLMVFLYGYKYSERIKIKLDIVVLKSLLVIGLPLLIYNLGFYLLTSLDRVMIIKYLGYIDLGYYTFSSQIVIATLTFISSVLFLYYPQAIKILNIDNGMDKEKIIQKTEEYTKYVEILGVILYLAGAILIVPLVYLVAPQYVESINIYRLLVFGTIATQIAYFSNVFIVSNKKQIYLIYLQIISLFIAFILNYTLIHLGYGIIGVSLATSITTTLYSVVQHFIYLKILNPNENHIKNTFKVYYKFTIFIVLGSVLTLLNMNILWYSIGLLLLTTSLYFNYFRFFWKNLINKKME
nr:oligosaccharide flippase family protein [Exiguobacterium sp. s26]